MPQLSFQVLEYFPGLRGRSITFRVVTDHKHVSSFDGCLGLFDHSNPVLTFHGDSEYTKKPMLDIIEARKRIRELVTPLKRQLIEYQVVETLGAYRDGKYDEDATQAVIEIYVNPTEDYPGGDDEDEDTNSPIRVVAQTRAEVIALAHAEVERKLPKWRQRIELDQAFSKAIGKQVRMLRVTDEFITNHDDEIKLDGPEFPHRKQFTLTPGMVLDVVRHEPGKLVLELGDNQFDFYFWKFTTYYTQSDPKNAWDPGVKVPDPYLEFTDGFAPWDVPGVTEDHDVARSSQG